MPSTYWYSPLSGIAVGPAGPPSKLVAQPHSSPSTALKVTAPAPVGENDFQWVVIPLPAPDMKVTGITLYYQVHAPAPGKTYISQTRLAKMTTPNQALVVCDDPTNLTSLAPAVHNTPVGGVPVDGAMYLELKMVVAQPADYILLGGIALHFA